MVFRSMRKPRAFSSLALRLSIKSALCSMSFAAWYRRSKMMLLWCCLSGGFDTPAGLSL